MKTPIYDRLKEIKEKDLVSFHMPGPVSYTHLKKSRRPMNPITMRIRS